MSGESHTTNDKPFVCTHPGCGEQFANEDHLLVHRQKHMSLKIDSAKVVLPDQTPTPTRFLKLIDQEGLFDTLKDSPFDQDFHKAASQEGGSQQVDAATSKAAATTSTSFTTGSLPAPTPIISSPYAITAIPVAPPTSISNPKKAVPVATPPTRVPDGAMSQQIKQTLRQHLQQENMKKALLGNMDLQTAVGLMSGGIVPPTTPEIIQEAFKNAIFPNAGLAQSQGMSSGAHSPDSASRRRSHAKDGEDDPSEKRQKFLERNRAAAARCRQKKKHWVEGLEKKAKDIEASHSTMQEEIDMLKQEIANLTNILLAHRDCPLLMSQQEQLKQLRTIDYQSVLSLGMQSNGTPDSSSSSETNAAVGKTVVVSSTTKDAETEQ